MFVSSISGPTNYVWGCFRTVKRPFINVLLLASYHAGIFPKWLTHDFGSKLGIFCVFVYSLNWPRSDVLGCLIDQEMKFEDILERWKDTKTIYKNPDVGQLLCWIFFPKGLAHDFRSKLENFFMCVYSLNWPGNDVWGRFKEMKRPPRPVLKTPISDLIFSKGVWFFVKI